MKPYFFDLNTRLFSEELLSEIKELVDNNLDFFVEYKFGEDDQTDGNNYYYQNKLNDVNELQTIIKKCSLKCFPMIVLHKPNSQVIKHIDDPYERNTVIITPVHPKDDYSPTHFWNNDETEIVATCNFKQGQSMLFNTQKMHSLNNDSDEYRYNLQICFDEDFETVLKLYQENKLFQE